MPGTRRPPLATAFALAGRFLLPLDPAVKVNDPAWSRAGICLPVWGVLIGIAYTTVFALMWLWLGEYQRIRLAPMAVLLAMDVGWLGYRLLQGSVSVLMSWRTRETAPADRVAAIAPTLGAVVLVVLVLLLKYALLLSLPKGEKTWPADWRQHLGIFYPYIMYRPLVLMPLWGRWAILMAATIGRVAPGGSNRLRRLADGSSLSMVMLSWLAICGLTVLYCSPDVHHVAFSMLIGLGSLLAAYLASFALARRFGGQTEATVMTVGAIVEFTFLLIYLPMARFIYWY